MTARTGSPISAAGNARFASIDATFDRCGEI
jgi:hypothetical protein